MAETASREIASASPANDQQQASRANGESDAALADASPSRANSATPVMASSSSLQAVNARTSADSPRVSPTPTSHSQQQQHSQRSQPQPSRPSSRQQDSRAHTPPLQHTTNSSEAPPSHGPLQPKSSPSTAEGADTSMIDTSAYGTRSRNRTGNNRPNYAEDQEMDFEFTSAATITASAKKKASMESNPTPTAAATKESTPVATPTHTAGATKKRKAANAAASHAASSTTSNAQVSAAARKLGTAASARETNVMTFTKQKACLNKRGELVADDGTKLAVNDHVYLVCEPPGDPYYLCRVMEFLHVQSDDPSSPIDALRVNWYYRPRDVQRCNTDSRLVYGTMHSDICPLTSLRGLCTIKHRSEIDDLEAYRKEPNHFYFVQVFDRFIRRWYECIPVAQIINVPDKVKKALDERWKFVVVETSRVKELTSAVKTCKRCTKYCASQDSVDCAICKNSYHMNCVQPPLPKKPSRGFAWACGPCSRASEREMESRNTPTVSGNVTEAEEELVEEEKPQETSNDVTRAPSPDSDIGVDDHPATQAEIALAKMWPMRYLGIHCRVEDALQYDDRAIYPRASSRLGPRHQAGVNVWHGHPVELVKAAEIRKRYQKGPGPKKDPKLTKEALAVLEAEREERAKRPKWVQDEPPGYVARGEDYPVDDPRCTAQLMFRMPDDVQIANERDAQGAPYPDADAFVKDYLKQAKPLARGIGVAPFGTNYLDKMLEMLTRHDYHASPALEKLKKLDRKKDLHEPVLSKAEVAKFEEGVAKHGSEHRLIRLHMKTNLPNSDIVRFYYLWKKTPKGREIWRNYGGRKSKHKVDTDAGSKLQTEVANDADDSAFDNDKASKRGRGFQCKFCDTTYARQWRKAPGVSPGQTVLVDAKNGNKDKKERLILALCLRCAGLWRKYAIQWEDIDEFTKKAGGVGGKAWKKRIDEELLREIVAASEASNTPPEPAVPSVENGEPPKKRSKTDKDGAPEVPKKKEKPAPPPKEATPPPPPIVPQQPTWKDLPCAICRGSNNTISCHHCRLTVHRPCYGLSEHQGLKPDGTTKWVCDQCENDRNPQVSTEYACCLCLTEETPVDLIEMPRATHKKKTDRDREKERMEKDLADAMRLEYRNKQLALHRPVIPREPLKRTTGNNWVHVHCALWTPEIRFSNAKALEVAEGFQLIPQSRFEMVCKLCKNKDHHNRIRQNAGACVSCFQCQTNFHASCAFEAGYTFGFDVTPVKGSRKDQIVTAKLGGEAGSVTPVILCKEHVVKTVLHNIPDFQDGTEDYEGGLPKTALQVFAVHYKQADLTLTGTVRKANLAQLTKDKGMVLAIGSAASGRRESGANSVVATARRGGRTSSVVELKTESEDMNDDNSARQDALSERECARCHVDVTPRWHLMTRDEPTSVREPTPPASPRGLHARHPSNHNDAADTDKTKQVSVDITGAPRRTHDGSSEQRPVQNGGDAWSHDTVQHYFCHKCFLSRHRELSPPAQERTRSPPAVRAPHRDWNRAAPSQPAFDHPALGHPPRMPWEDGQHSVSHTSPPVAPVAGLGLASPYAVPPLAQPPVATYGHPQPPPFASQPNGYHATPSHHAPPPMHDRAPNAVYGTPPNSTAYSFGHHSRPPPLSNYLPTSQPVPNGLPSPRGHHPAMSASPQFHTPYPAYPPRQHESANTSPHMSGLRPVPHERTYLHPPESAVGVPPPPPVNHAVPHGGGHVGPLRPDGPPGTIPPRASSPRDGHRNTIAAVPTTTTTNGASLSPSLRNLLH